MFKHKEIILVRVLGNNRESIVGDIGMLLQEIVKAEKSVSIELYMNLTLPTDISVHIDYYEKEKKNSVSDLGRHLAEALKNFGFVSHSLWIADKNRRIG